MKKNPLSAITSKDLVDHAAISLAFKQYLVDILLYEEAEADFVVSNDFGNPYDCPYIMQDYEGEITIYGKRYEVRSCYTDFFAVGMFHLDTETPFKFYMLFDLETMPDTTVGAYRSAQKMYIC